MGVRIGYVLGYITQDNSLRILSIILVERYRITERGLTVKSRGIGKSPRWKDAGTKSSLGDLVAERTGDCMWGAGVPAVQRYGPKCRYHLYISVEIIIFGSFNPRTHRRYRMYKDEDSSYFCDVGSFVCYFPSRTPETHQFIVETLTD